MLFRSDDLGIRTKSWTTQDGRVRTGGRFSKTGIHYLLKCVAYVGKIPHKEKIYDGNHDAIVPMEMWTSVQEHLKAQWGVRRISANQKSRCWLVGLMFDEEGRRFTNVKTTKAGRQYHYYVTGSKAEAATGSGWRLQAKDIEHIVRNGTREALQDPARLFDLIKDGTNSCVSAHQLQRMAARAADLEDEIGRAHV